MGNIGHVILWDFNTPIARYNWLSNRFNNWLYRVNKHPTCCQTGLTTGWMFVYTIQPVPVWQPCWTNSHCSFNRLSNRVVQPVWQPAVYTIQPVVKPV